MLAHAVFRDVFNVVSRFIVGYNDEIKIIFSALFSGGHVLIEGVPGVAKTLLAKLIARSLSLKFKRIQMAPDILPSDIIGFKAIDPKTGELRTILGPIFANIILVDEINRAPPKTQVALLEAMQEKHVTIEGDVYELPKPFMVIATMNPVEVESVFPLPEAELDRFSVSVNLGYLSRDEEIEIVKREQKILKGREPTITPIVDVATVLKVIDEVMEVHVDSDILKYIVDIIRATRTHESVHLGASPRSAVTLLRVSKAYAALNDRDYVIPDDVKHAAYYVLPHRLILKDKVLPRGAHMTQRTLALRVVEDVLKSIKPPW